MVPVMDQSPYQGQILNETLKRVKKIEKRKIIEFNSFRGSRKPTFKKIYISMTHPRANDYQLP